MNIVIIGNFTYPFGSASASRIRNIAEELVANNHTVHLLPQTILFKNKYEWEEHKGVRYKYSEPGVINRMFKNVSSNLFHYILSFFNFGAAQIHDLEDIKGIDLILVYDYSFFKVLPFHFYCCKKKIPYVRDIVECFTPASFIGGLFNPLYYDHLVDYYYLAKKCDGIIAISNYIKKSFESHLPVIVIPAIIETNQAAQQAVESNSAVTNFTYISSLNKRDLPDLVLDAIVKMSSKNFKLNIIGNSGARGHARHIKQKIQNNNHLASVINFCGRVSDAELLKIKAQTNCFIFLRNNDKAGLAAFPTRMPEYLVTGKPVIASDVGDLSYYLTDNKDALLIDNTASGLRAALNKVIDLPDEAKDIGKKGYQTCQVVFNRKERVLQIVDFFFRIEKNNNIY